MGERRDLNGDGSYIMDRRHFEESSLTLGSWPAAYWVIAGRSWEWEPSGPYSGIGFDAADVELYVSVPEGMKREVSEGPVWAQVDRMWEDFEKERERVERGGVEDEDLPRE